MRSRDHARRFPVLEPAQNVDEISAEAVELGELCVDARHDAFEPRAGVFPVRVAEEGVTARDIAEAIGRRLNLPIASIPAESAMSHFGLLALLIAGDHPSSSALTRERLGWQPREVDLITDI